MQTFSCRATSAGDHASTVLEVLEQMISEHQEREAEHMQKRRMHLAQQAKDNDDFELSEAWLDPNKMSDVEVRERISANHADYVVTIAELNRKATSTNVIVGLTTAERARLARGQQWLAREQAKAAGDAGGSFGSQETNKRNVSYLLIIKLIAAATVVEWGKLGKQTRSSLPWTSRPP